MKTPTFKLKEEVKDIILKNSALQGTIMAQFDISYSTLRRWIVEDAMQLTNYSLLFLLWDYLKLKGYEYKKLTDLMEMEIDTSSSLIVF